MKPRLIRTTTVPISLTVLLKGQLEFMKNYFDLLAVSSGPISLLNEIEQTTGVPCRYIKMTRKISPLTDLISLIKFYFLCLKFRPLIVHSHTPKAGIVAMLAAKLAGVPIRIHTVAGMPLLESNGVKRILLEFIEKITYACATKVLPNSNVMSNIILEKKFTTISKLKVIAKGSSNGIDTEYFNPGKISDSTKEYWRNKIGLSKSDFVFIFIGRIVSDKGVNELIKAFLKLDSPNTKLLLLGDKEVDLDPLLPETNNLLDTSLNIIHLNFQNDIRPFLTISDVLVFPSYREGFPNVVMQAGSMGLASIVTNINGCNEIIVDNVNGIIVPPKNANALYNAMRLIMSNNNLRCKLSQNARKMIVDRYEQKIVWQSLLEEYVDLCKYQGIQI